MADYIDEDAEGRLIPPPKVCPECGGKTKRLGNGNYRGVFCTAPAMRWCQAAPDYGYMTKACTWNKTVFHVPASMEDREWATAP